MMELDGALLVELEVPNIHFKNSTAMLLSRNHDSVTQEDLQTTLWAVSSRNYFLSIKQLSPTTKWATTHGWEAHRSAVTTIVKTLFNYYLVVFNLYKSPDCRKTKSLKKITPSQDHWFLWKSALFLRSYGWQVWSHYFGEKADHSATVNSKILHLKLNQLRWIDSTTFKWKKMHFDFFGWTAL